MTTDIRESTDWATDTSGSGLGTENVAAFVPTDRDDINLLRPLFNTGLTQVGWRWYVTEAFTLFLRMERKAIGREAETSNYCEICGNISEPLYAQSGWLCPRCDSERLLRFTGMKGREVIYNRLITHRNDSL